MSACFGKPYCILGSKGWSGCETAVVERFQGDGISRPTLIFVELLRWPFAAFGVGGSWSERKEHGIGNYEGEGTKWTTDHDLFGNATFNFWYLGFHRIDYSAVRPIFSQDILEILGSSPLWQNWSEHLSQATV